MATRTAAQIEASRRNGARSRGPKTIEGKARSSANARTHGLRARTPTPVGADHRAALGRIEAITRQSVRPANAEEAACCARIALARWQVERANALERTFWAEGAALAGPGPSHQVRALRAASRTRSLGTVLRYQAAAERALAAARCCLAGLRAPERSEEPDATASHQRTRDERTGRAGLPHRLDPLAPPPARIARASSAGTDRPAALTPSAAGPAPLPSRPGGTGTDETMPPAPPLNRHQRRRQAAALRERGRRAA